MRLDVQDTRPILSIPSDCPKICGGQSQMFPMYRFFVGDRTEL